GMMSAAAAPMSARHAISCHISPEADASTAATRKTTRPSCNTPLRPKRSPMAPVENNSPANTSEYAATTHWSWDSLACSSRHKVLADTATELFAEQGFDHTTVEEIAEACDVSPRTFFRYFSSKEDVLFAAGDERLRQLLDAIASRPSDESPLRSMREAALSLVPEYTSDRAQLIARKR